MVWLNKQNKTKTFYNMQIYGSLIPSDRHFWLTLFLTTYYSHHIFLRIRKKTKTKTMCSHEMSDLVSVTNGVLWAPDAAQSLEYRRFFKEWILKRGWPFRVAVSGAMVLCFYSPVERSHGYWLPRKGHASLGKMALVSRGNVWDGAIAIGLCPLPSQQLGE